MRRHSVSYRLLLALAAVVVASLALPTAARAQAVYGSIAGTIEDSTGAAVPGVNVTITSVERKTSDTVVTNGSGNYIEGPAAARHLLGQGRADAASRPALGLEGRGERRHPDQGRPQARAWAR